MLFLKAASENTLLLLIIEGFGRSLYRNAVLLERERLPRFVTYDYTLALKAAAPVINASDNRWWPISDL